MKDNRNIKIIAVDEQEEILNIKARKEFIVLMKDILIEIKESYSK